MKPNRYKFEIEISSLERINTMFFSEKIFELKKAEPGSSYSRARKQLVSEIFEMGESFRVLPLTVHLAIEIMDRFA